MSIGRFRRNLDSDVVSRVLAGTKPHTEPKGIKHVKSLRSAQTYRAARRNVARGTGRPMIRYDRNDNTGSARRTGPMQVETIGRSVAA